MTEQVNSHDVTLVMPIYNMHNFVRRVLLYYSAFPITLVIADGSEKSLDLAPTGYYNFLKWHYFHIPGAKTYPLRISMGLNYVNTEFFALIDGGDLLYYSGLCSAVNELKQDNAIKAAGGIAGSVVPNHRLSSGHFVNLYRAYQHWSLPYQSVLNDQPIEAMLRALNESRTVNLMYLLMRTRDYRDLFRDIYSERIDAIEMYELVTAGILAATTSINLANYPFWLHSGRPSIPSTDWVPRTEWTVSTHHRQHQIVVESIVAAVESISGQILDKENIEKYFETHLNKYYFRHDLNALPEMYKRLSTSYIESWSCLIQRELTIDEINDLARVDALFKLFPEGVARIPSAI